MWQAQTEGILFRQRRCCLRSDDIIYRCRGIPQCAPMTFYHLCLIFIASIDRVSKSVTPFARIIGREWRRIPYTNQSKTPVLIIRYMRRLISFVERVLHTFMNCGRYAMVVRIAARNPIISVNYFYINNKKTTSRIQSWIYVANSPPW